MDSETTSSGRDTKIQDGNCILLIYFIVFIENEIEVN